MTGAYTSLPMVASAVIYLVAMVAHAIEWASASARRPAEVSERVLVGSGGAEVEASESNHRVALFGRIGVALTVVGALTHIAGVVLRGIAAERWPWGNMYEFVTTRWRSPSCSTSCWCGVGAGRGSGCR